MPFGRQVAAAKHLRDESPLQSISEMHHAFDSLNHPVVAPPIDGWDITAKQTPTSDKKLTCRDHCLFRLHERPGEGVSPILHAGRLTQEIFVDMHLRLEGQRLNFLSSKTMQVKMHKTTAGKAFVGLAAPRAMAESMQDALAILHEFGCVALPHALRSLPACMCGWCPLPFVCMHVQRAWRCSVRALRGCDHCVAVHHVVAALTCIAAANRFVFDLHLQPGMARDR